MTEHWLSDRYDRVTIGYLKKENVMKISIVVPVYKAQDFLADCCKSVLQQSYQDYELI